jgi:hypothetical protein
LAGWVALVLLILAAFAIVLRSDAGPLFGFGPAQLAAAAFAFALFIVVARPLLRSYREHMGMAARHLLVWLGRNRA